MGSTESEELNRIQEEQKIIELSKLVDININNFMKLTKGHYSLEDVLGMDSSTVETIMEENVKELQEQEKRLKEQNAQEDMMMRKNASKSQTYKGGSLSKFDPNQQIGYYK